MDNIQELIDEVVTDEGNIPQCCDIGNCLDPVAYYALALNGLKFLCNDHYCEFIEKTEVANGQRRQHTNLRA